MDSSILLLSSSSGPLPPVPDRNKVCSVKLTLGGLIVTTNEFGSLPWFEPAYQCLNDANDRKSVIEQKKLAGDTHLILEYFTKSQPLYNEPGQPYQDIITFSGENEPQRFRNLVLEVISSGLIPIVSYDGDEGYQGAINALRQLPILTKLLKDLAPYILFARLWDGVFYGSSPEQIKDFGEQFRLLLPDGYLAIEHSFGHIPTGEGDVDYINNGAMTTYDVILSEFDFPPANDTIWQIAARLLGPSYIRPYDQPPNDDPGSPFGADSGKYYLRQGNPRGPYFPIAFEWWNVYNWVRVGNPFGPNGVIMQAQIELQCNYLKSVGYKYTG